MEAAVAVDTECRVRLAAYADRAIGAARAYHPLGTCATVDAEPALIKREKRGTRVAVEANATAAIG